MLLLVAFFLWNKNPRIPRTMIPPIIPRISPRGGGVDDDGVMGYTGAAPVMPRSLSDARVELVIAEAATEELEN